MRKQAEQAMKTKPVNCTTWFLLFQLLPPGSCPVWAPALTSLGIMIQNMHAKLHLALQVAFGHGDLSER